MIDQDMKRALGSGLRRLAHLDAIAHGGIEELRQLAEDTCGRFKDGMTTVSPYVHASTEDNWTVEFSNRVLLTFLCEIGRVASPDPVIARCEVRGAAAVVATLHLVKTNDHGTWYEVPDNLGSATLVDDALIARLLYGAVEEALRAYPRG